MEEIVSPCISVCKLDAGSGLCNGCWRTRAEIAGWRSMDNDARREVLERLHERRLAAGVGTARRANRRRRKVSADALPTVCDTLCEECQDQGICVRNISEFKQNQPQGTM